MARYFIDLAYIGTNYSGFQIQQNANTIQAEVEKALKIFFRTAIHLTGSSRTDAGVHAYQNFFHFDVDAPIDGISRAVYHLNAILPEDIVVRDMKHVMDDAHCRFDAISRSYEYTVYTEKNPFINDRAYYIPYPPDVELLNTAASMIMNYRNFKSFAKKNIQSHTYECLISKSGWKKDGSLFIYTVTGNRFLRGMVRGLVGTMLLTARNKYSMEKFRSILENEDASFTDFSAPAKGLILKAVLF
jgi:tRNA pseudouridine38-40 synthase